VSDALAEAVTLVPVEEVIHHTLEIRHPTFIDDAGNADSVRIVASTENLVAPFEVDAPVKAGQWVNFTAVGSFFALASIEFDTTSDIEITIDGVDRSLIEYLNLAMTAGMPITVAYRSYLASTLGDGPQMDPVPTFDVADVSVGLTNVKLRALTGVGLQGGLPTRIYKPADFPGLIEQMR
jgi:hypothetical protein